MEQQIRDFEFELLQETTGQQQTELLPTLTILMQYAALSPIPLARVSSRLLLHGKIILVVLPHRFVALRGVLD